MLQINNIYILKRIDSLQSPAVVEVHPVPMGQWGEQMLLGDWLAERLEACLLEEGFHSGLGTLLEHHAGTALMTDHLKEKDSVGESSQVWAII